MNAPAIRHGSCVSISGRALLIEGPPGSGKSSLALALIDRGAELVGDDAVTLEMREGRLWACPPPNIAGMLEVRNVGIVRLPAVEAPLALVARLDAAAERYIEQADRLPLEGQPVPLIRLWPGSAQLALRAEWALQLYGAG